jgi:hypothetical protein
MGFRWRQLSVMLGLKQIIKNGRLMVVGVCFWLFHKGLKRRQRMKKLLFLCVLFAGMLLVPALSAAGWSPLQVAIWHPIQMVPDQWDVYGMRMNLIYGKNKNVWGVDVGVANTTEGPVRGIQAGVINGPGDLDGIGVGGINSTRRVNGFQAGLFSVAEERVTGIQLSALFNQSPVVRGLQLHAGISGNFSDDVMGAQIGAGLPTFNQAEVMRGVQISPIGANYVNKSMKGFQLSIYNSAGIMSGFQLGIVNYAEEMKGLQVGLLNVVKNSPLPFLPIFQLGL